MKFGDFTAMDQENRLELKWSIVVLIWGALHYCAMGREGRSSPAGLLLGQSDWNTSNSPFL